MKKISSKIIYLILLMPISLLAHDGHVHTGTFWENAGHFMLTNAYLVLPALVATYFLVKSLRAKAKIKIK